MININQWLALYWPLDNLDNSSTNDITGNFHQGTVEGAVELTDDLVFNTVARFGNGSASIYTQPDSINNAFVNQSTQFTVCGWINPTTLTDQLDSCQLGNVFFSFGTPDQSVVEIGLSPDNEVQVYILTQSGPVTQLSSYPITSGNWNFIALSYARNVMQILVNTQLEEFVLVEPPWGLDSPSAAFLRLGKSADEVCYFQGLICNLRVYNSALDVIRLMAIMKADLSSPLQLFLPLNSEGLTNTPDKSQSDYPVVAQGDTKPSVVLDAQLGAVTQFDGSAAYFAIDDFHYENQGEIQRITISFWFKTDDQTSTQTILSFDATDFYEVNILPTGTLAWITVDRYGNVDTLDSTIVVTNNIWYYVTLQYSAGSGNKTISFGAVQHVQKPNPHLGQPLGLHSSVRYGTIGVNSVASSYNTGIGDQFFHGSLAQLRIYNSILTPSQIQFDMDNSYPAGASFASSNPLTCFFGSEANPNTFYYGDNSALSYNITLNIKNISPNTPLTLNANGGVVTAANAQFILFFKQGVIDPNIPLNIGLAESNSWNLSVVTSQTDGGIYFYLNAVNDIILNPNDIVLLVFENLYLNPAGGAKSARIGVNYQNCFTHAQANIEGYVEVVVNIIEAN